MHREDEVDTVITKEVAMRLAWLVSSLVLAACGASASSMNVTVRRAPWISFAGHPDVTTRFSATCAGLHLGPEDAPPKPGITIGRALLERSDRCNEQVSSIGSSIEREAHDALRRRGHRVGGGTPLVANLAIHMQTKVSPERHQDTQKDQRCQKQCGRSTCYIPWVSASIEVKGTFSGPRGRAAGSDKVDREIIIDAPLRKGEGGALSCSIDDARKWSSFRYYDWDSAARAVVAWYRQTFQRMLLPYDEEVELRLFEVDSPPEAALGLNAGRARKWGDALEHYQIALQLVLDANDREVLPLIRHNLATTLMELGRLDEALPEARRARADGQDDAPDALIEEIETRINDREREG